MNTQNIVYGSDRIDQLPQPTKPLNPTDYARLLPLMPNTQESYSNNTKGKNIKHYLIVAALFILLSFSFTDNIILAVFPTLQNFSYLMVLVKAILFVVGLYLIERFY